MSRNQNSSDLSFFPISSERLKIRRFSKEDLAAFQAYRRDQDLARFQGWEAWSNDEALRFITDMSKKELFLPDEWIQLAIEDTEGCLIGDIGLYLSKDRTESKIGYTLCKSSQGKGFAIEAVRAVVELVFSQTPVLKMYAITDRRNAPSVRLIKRLGMKLLHSEEVEFKGEQCIEDTYCLVRENFRLSSI